jgi:hypothetical protein
MRFYTVDVKSITSNVPRSNFAESELDRLAELILDSDGLIRPLVLKQTGVEEYTVIDGHLEYYAAVRAKEKNPRRGEMVNAFEIVAKSEAVITKQLETLKGLLNAPTVTVSNVGSDSRLTNIELRFEQRMNEIRADLIQQAKEFNDQIKAIESKIPQQAEPLKLLNTLSENDLVVKLTRSRISGAEKLAKSIILARTKQPEQQFLDYRSVVKAIKGFGDTTMLTIIDEWSKG